MVKNLSSSPHESCGRDLGTISWNFLVQNPHEETSNDRFHEPPAVLVWRLYQEFRSDLCRGLPVILPLALLIACRMVYPIFLGNTLKTLETPRNIWKHPETLETHRNTQFLPQNWVRLFPLTRIRDLDLDPWVREYVDTFACPPGLTYPGIQA